MHQHDIDRVEMKSVEWKGGCAKIECIFTHFLEFFGLDSGVLCDIQTSSYSSHKDHHPVSEIFRVKKVFHFMVGIIN